MSEQWVIGRYADGRWEWLANAMLPYRFTNMIDEARRFTPLDANYLWDMTSTNECIVHIDAAKAIAERWAK